MLKYKVEKLMKNSKQKKKINRKKKVLALYAQ